MSDDSHGTGKPRDECNAANLPEGDPVEVHPSDSRAESQAGLNGPSGSPTSPSGRVVDTPLGRFRKVGGPTVPFFDRWLFECPGCNQWAYLDDDQWHGRVSVDHAADGCPGGYHETHNYFAALEAACNRPG